jgi:CheY-like chemotaxis protein
MTCTLPSPAAPKFDTARVLIVDDEPQMRRLNECSLRLGGFENFFFGKNGREAVEMAHRVQPDLIIIDYTMPEMDGLCALHYLKSFDRTADIPVIMVSGCTELHEEHCSECSAAEAVLRKPCCPEELLEVAQRVLSA